VYDGDNDDRYAAGAGGERARQGVEAPILGRLWPLDRNPTVVFFERCGSRPSAISFMIARALITLLIEAA
jgi:hypothetical protein